MRCHHVVPSPHPTDPGVRRLRRSGLATAVGLAAVLLSPFPARAQTSPLTLQPATPPAQGPVGIGTTTPAELLHVYAVSGQNAGVRLSSHAGNTNTILKVVDEPVTNNGGLRIQTGGGTAILAVDNSNQRVGIKTTQPGAALHVIGDIYKSGTNGFLIDHPLDPQAKRLAHVSLEGPEAGVYYRGEAQLDKGEAVVSLPLYFEALTEPTGRTVQLTPVGGWAPLYVVSGVQGGRFIVRAAAGGDPSQRFYWEVKAVRRDIAPLVLEWPKPVELPPPPAQPPSGG